MYAGFSFLFFSCSIEFFLFCTIRYLLSARLVDEALIFISRMLMKIMLGLSTWFFVNMFHRFSWKGLLNLNHEQWTLWTKSTWRNLRERMFRQPFDQLHDLQQHWKEDFRRWFVKIFSNKPWCLFFVSSVLLFLLGICFIGLFSWSFFCRIRILLIPMRCVSWSRCTYTHATDFSYSSATKKKMKKTIERKKQREMCVLAGAWPALSSLELDDVSTGVASSDIFEFQIIESGKKKRSVLL